MYFCDISLAIGDKALHAKDKVREGRRTANLPKLCGFLNCTAISEHI